MRTVGRRRERPITFSASAARLIEGGETYESLKKFSETVDLEGIPVRTVNLDGLLLTKQGMREKDVSDRIILEKALKVLRESSR